MPCTASKASQVIIDEEIRTNSLLVSRLTRELCMRCEGAGSCCIRIQLKVESCARRCGMRGMHGRVAPQRQSRVRQYLCGCAWQCAGASAQSLAAGTLWLTSTCTCESEPYCQTLKQQRATSPPQECSTAENILQRSPRNCWAGRQRGCTRIKSLARASWKQPAAATCVWRIAGPRKGARQHDNDGTRRQGFQTTCGGHAAGCRQAADGMCQTTTLPRPSGAPRGAASDGRRAARADILSTRPHKDRQAGRKKRKQAERRTLRAGAANCANDAHGDGHLHLLLYTAQTRPWVSTYQRIVIRSGMQHNLGHGSWHSAASSPCDGSQLATGCAQGDRPLHAERSSHPRSIHTNQLVALSN